MRAGDLVTPRSGLRGRAPVGIVVYDPQHEDKVVVRFGSVDRLMRRADLQHVAPQLRAASATA